MQQQVQSAWRSVRDGLAALSARLLHAADFSLAETDRALTTAEDAFSAFVEAYSPERPIPPATLHDEWGPRLLESPADPLRKRGHTRALSAVQEFRAALETLVRPLPAEVDCSWSELAAAFASEAAAPTVPVWRRRQKPVNIPLRALALAQLERQSRDRARLDGDIQLLLAESTLAALEPWQTCRWLARRAQLGEAPSAEQAAKELASFRSKLAGLRSRAATAQSQYRQWATELPATVLQRLVSRGAPEDAEKEAAYEETLRYWFRQQRGVHTFVELEFGVLALDRRGEQILHSEQRSLRAEHADIREELDQVVAWLQAQRAGARPEAFPPAKARLVPAEERVRSWSAQLSAASEALLPVAAETVNPQGALPGLRPPWKPLQPRNLFRAAVETAGRPVLLAAFTELEAAHQAAVQEIEHAREVVAYGLEQELETDGPSENLLAEALQNAASLLDYQRQNLPDIDAILERAAWHAQASLALELDVALEESRWGFWAYRTRRKWRSRLEKALRAGLARVRTAGAWAWTAAAKLPNKVLLELGWITAPELPTEAVLQRARLEEVLNVALIDRDVPAIYRRLFRLAPVEDPRFLVGRESELNGIADALSRWQCGQFAAVMLVGMRGSGKSSLLNVAIRDHLKDQEVTRCQLHRRVSSIDGLHAELRKLLDLKDNLPLETALAERKRVVILEEFERSFIRDMNGFTALDELVRLVQATAAHVLWIVSLNEVSFRYLEAVKGVSRHFSHRVNAVAVGRDNLVAAIAQRHGLSGLRLEFAPLPEGDPRIGKLRRLLGVEPDAEEAFYTSLYQQSEGVFRAAFELWQACVERVEGGVVYMRQPLNPKFASLLGELNPDDYFTLQAIVQHGGLTVEEVGQVLRQPPEVVHMRMERLRQIGLIEDEPECAGMRIAPEAGGVVRDALTRRNLY
jgi:hypothetical protein